MTNPRPVVLFALWCLSIMAWAQRGKEKPVPVSDELDRIHHQIDLDQRTEARAALTKLMAEYDSPRAFFELARLDIREGDSTAYCQDLAQAKLMEVEAIDGLYDQHCVQVDSGGLSRFGLDDTPYPGLLKAKRFRYRSDGSTQIYLFDRFDSAHVGLRIERDTVSYILLDTMPVFTGGDSAKFAFMRNNHRYPDREYELGIQGRVMVRFTVGTDGRITDIQVVQRASPGLDKEAVRMVGLMPPWRPGRLNGKPVRAMINFPINFQLR